MRKSNLGRLRITPVDAVQIGDPKQVRLLLLHYYNPTKELTCI